MDIYLFILVIFNFVIIEAEDCYTIKKSGKKELLYCPSVCCGSEEERDCCDTDISTGIIVGGVTGGLVAIVLLLTTIVCCCIKPKTKTIRRVAVETADGRVEELYSSERNRRHNRQTHGHPQTDRTLPDIEETRRSRRHRSRTDHPPPTISSELMMMPPPAYGQLNYYNENHPDYEPPPAYKE